MSKPIVTPSPAAQPTMVGTGYSEFGNFLIKRSGFTDIKPSIDGEADLYVIGKGKVVLSAKALLPGKAVSAQSYTSIGSMEKPLIAGIVQYRQPASGLDPEKYVSVLLVIDPATSSVLKETEVLRDDTEFGVAKNLTGSNGNVVSFYFNAPQNDDGITRAYDAMSGKMLWERPGFTTASVTGAVALQSVGPGFNSGGDPCYKATGVDIATGKDLWNVNYIDVARGCSNINIGWTSKGGMTVGRAVGMKYVHVSGEQDSNFNALTGAAVTLPDQVASVDPLSSLVAGSPAHAYIDSAPLIVTDAASGDEKFTLDAERVKQLNAQVEALHGGKLYLKTTDQHPVVDIATGKTIEDNAKRYPICVVRQRTYWSDGMLEPTTK
ncbi:hypothetical protein [Arthrobacter sp. B1I2]|uniref:hypothetical protein n=1 Tax=Arthrobacter sp. B1I2 TaxID=3042263 RepID=UPI0027831A8E|nr:hypothetical protein [Arthrobacter sp. B1I2]MDQ0733202.1 hypothetical protein [Arthrobacter sp. B1I2]